jgi:hypothetical protein
MSTFSETCLNSVFFHAYISPEASHLQVLWFAFACVSVWIHLHCLYHNSSPRGAKSQGGSACVEVVWITHARTVCLIVLYYTDTILYYNPAYVRFIYVAAR